MVAGNLEREGGEDARNDHGEHRGDLRVRPAPLGGEERDDLPTQARPSHREIHAPGEHDVHDDRGDRLVLHEPQGAPNGDEDLDGEKRNRPSDAAALEGHALTRSGFCLLELAYSKHDARDGGDARYYGDEHEWLLLVAGETL